MLIPAAIIAALPLAGVGAQPLFETGQLGAGLQGDVEIPTLGTSDGNTIYCVYSANISSIWIQATEDAGKTWSEPVQVMGLPGPNYITDANLLVDGDRITVFATHAMPREGQEGKIARSVFRVAVSEDRGQTWTQQDPLPVARRYVCGCVHSPVWLDGDTVVMGYSWDLHAEADRPVADEGAMTIRSGVLISHDRGRTWTPGADAGPDIPTMGLDEPALVRLANGDLFAILRTNQARPYETVSHDGGLTWDPVQPSRLRGFNSPAALCRLADGDILRAWDNSSANRYPLVVALSRDECETWSRARTVATPATTPEGGLSFDTACYPTIAQAADGTILLAWWQRARGRNSVHYARLSREWLDEVALTPQPPKVVAFGDSVTRGVRPGVTEAQTFAALLQAGLQERGVEVEVVNAGLGSDTTAGGLARMDRDVLAEEPQAVVIMFGLNDACVVDGGPVAREEPRVSLTDYAANLRTMVSRAQAAGAAVVLCTPNPMTRAYLYSDMSGYAENDDMNYLVREYAQAVEELGQEVAVPVVDVFSLFEDRPGGLDLIQDGCHPYVEGHRLIAEALLPVVQAALDRGR